MNSVDGNKDLQAREFIQEIKCFWQLPMFLFCFPQIPAIMIILLNVVFHLHALVVIDYEPAIWEKALRHPRMGGCIVRGDG